MERAGRTAVGRTPCTLPPAASVEAATIPISPLVPPPLHSSVPLLAKAGGRTRPTSFLLWRTRCRLGRRRERRKGRNRGRNRRRLLGREGAWGEEVERRGLSFVFRLITTRLGRQGLGFREDYAAG